MALPDYGTINISICIKVVTVIVVVILVTELCMLIYLV